MTDEKNTYRVEKVSDNEIYYYIKNKKYKQRFVQESKNGVKILLLSKSGTRPYGGKIKGDNTFHLGTIYSDGTATVTQPFNYQLQFNMFYYVFNNLKFEKTRFKYAQGLEVLLEKGCKGNINVIRDIPLEVLQEVISVVNGGAPKKTIGCGCTKCDKCKDKCLSYEERPF